MSRLVTSVTAFMLLLTVAVSSAAADEGKDTFEIRFKIIEQNFAILQNRNINVADLKKRLDKIKDSHDQFIENYSDTELPRNNIRKKTFLKELQLSHKIIQLELKSLETDTEVKVGTVQRLDILYLLMIVMGLLIIVGITVYTIIMYSKRK